MTVDVLIVDASSGRAVQRAPTPDEAAIIAADQKAGLIAVQQEEEGRAARVSAGAIVKNIAGATVGKSAATLNATDVRALFVVWLWERGALDAAARIRPLDQWIGR